MMDQPLSSLDLDTNKLESLIKMGYNYCQELPESQDYKELMGETPKTLSAWDLLEAELCDAPEIFCCINELDCLLKEVFTMQSVMELNGLAGSGKTQICLHLAIGAQLSRDIGGLDGDTIYLSTDQSFPIDRFKEIAGDIIKKFSLNHLKIEDFCKRTYIMEIATLNELMASINSFRHSMPDHCGKVKLLIIDSVFYPLKDSNYEERSGIIFTFFQDLRQLLYRHNLRVVLVNGMTTKILDGENKVVPCFGESFAHCINSRIVLARKNDQFYAKVDKSIVWVPKEIEFKL